MSDGNCDNICPVIGRTPVVRLNRIPKDGWAEMLAKLESFNPGGSVKGRLGLGMIEAAEQEGRLNPGGTVEEARAVARRLAELEEILCGVSSGAILHAASTVSQDPGRGKRTVFGLTYNQLSP